MRVVTAQGETIELGTTETTPTIGITDYSRRVTDDFGVTTVVERGFARRMSVRLGVAFDAADALQRRLAALRATAARWIADDRIAWLSAQGFYKDFEIDLATPTLSYCTLTVEGLTETEAMADPGGDPAPAGMASTLRLLRPLDVTDAVLVSSSVAQTDQPEWSAQASYAQGAQVIRAATHRVYESAVAGNVSNDPVQGSGKWIDIGPTNRWAMFDQALGTATSATAPIVVKLAPGTATALALLDVTGAAVRVQANGYDRTEAVGAGAILFTDLPGAGQVTVTISGPDQVSVGTLLVGSILDLGVTEASPTAGITDYSRKEVDDFGAVTVVQRAWAKKMSARALLRTDAVDMVANRIAGVRARPSLWIGQSGMDSLTVYGFFKDFSIEVGETTAKLSLSIEGLSAAAKIAPLQTSIDWPDIGDPLGTKPADNADVTADHLPAAFEQYTGRSAKDVVSDLSVALESQLVEMLRNATYRGETDQILTMPDGSTLREVTQVLSALVNGVAAYVADQRSVDSLGRVKAVLLLSSGGHQIGTVYTNDGTVGTAYTVADEWGFIDPGDANDPNAVPTKPFYYVAGRLYAGDMTVTRLRNNTAVVPARAKATSPIKGTFPSSTGDPLPLMEVLRAVVTLAEPGWIDIDVSIQQGFTSTPAPWHLEIQVNGHQLDESPRGGVEGTSGVQSFGSYYASAAGDYVVTAMWQASTAVTLAQRAIRANGQQYTV